MVSSTDSLIDSFEGELYGGILSNIGFEGGAGFLSCDGGLFLSDIAYS